MRHDSHAHVGNAAKADPLAAHLARVWHALHDDWQAKTAQITRLELELAEILVKTPYILLLSQPGINVVSGRKLYHHSSQLDRQYVLDKLLKFHQDHGTPPHEILRDLQEAAQQIPRSDQAAEASPLKQTCERIRRSRRRDPQPIGTILIAVLAKLGITELQSESEALSPDANMSDVSS